jgi:hypothetical protein
MRIGASFFSFLTSNGVEMKKLFFLLLLAGTSKNINSQIIIAVLFGDKLNTGKLEFGLVLSPALANLSNSGGDFRSALNLAMFFNIKPYNKFFIHAELTPKASFGAKNIDPYSLGSDSLNAFFNEGSVERIIKTMGVTVLGRYTISQKIFADAGIQTDLLYKPRDIFTTTFNNSELQYTQKLDERFTRLDLQLAGGLFYKFKPDRGSMGIGIRYVHGLTDIDKLMAGSQVNISWQANITIPIGAVPKEKHVN